MTDDVDNEVAEFDAFLRQTYLDIEPKVMRDNIDWDNMEHVIIIQTTKDGALEINTSRGDMAANLLDIERIKLNVLQTLDEIL